MAYRPHGSGSYGTINITGRLTPAVLYLIAANAAVFLLSVFSPGFFLRYFSLVAAEVWPRLQVWRLVTYLFMHIDFSHFLFNMITLYFFGPPLEQVWGRDRFLFYFFLTGVGAGLLSVPYYYLLGQAGVPVIGASGSLFGLLAAFALLYPNAYIYFMFLVPIKAKWLVLFFVVMEFAASASALGGGASGGIANIVHLSGALIGYFYLRGLMDVKAWPRRLRSGRRKKPLRIIRPPDDERGPWIH